MVWNRAKDTRQPNNFLAMNRKTEVIIGRLFIALIWVAEIYIIIDALSHGNWWATAVPASYLIITLLVGGTFFKTTKV